MLPQGMMNSPTMSQYYVAKALEPVRKQFPDFLVIHYMDDILFLAPSVLETQRMFNIAQRCLKDSDAGRDWGQEEKGTTEDEMAGWHHRLDGHEFE